MQVTRIDTMDMAMIRSTVEAIGISIMEVVLGVIEVVVDIVVGAVVEVTVHVRLIEMMSIAVVEAMETVVTPVGSIGVSEVVRKHFKDKIIK